MSIYCAIDLHADNHMVMVIDDGDRIVLRKRLVDDLAVVAPRQARDHRLRQLQSDPAVAAGAGARTRQAAHQTPDRRLVHHLLAGAVGAQSLGEEHREGLGRRIEPLAVLGQKGFNLIEQCRARQQVEEGEGSVCSARRRARACCPVPARGLGCMRLAPGSARWVFDDFRLNTAWAGPACVGGCGAYVSAIQICHLFANASPFHEPLGARIL